MTPLRCAKDMIMKSSGRSVARRQNYLMQELIRWFDCSWKLNKAYDWSTTYLPWWIINTSFYCFLNNNYCRVQICKETSVSHMRHHWGRIIAQNYILLYQKHTTTLNWVGSGVQAISIFCHHPNLCFLSCTQRYCKHELNWHCIFNAYTKEALPL